MLLDVVEPLPRQHRDDLVIVGTTCPSTPSTLGLPAVGRRPGGYPGPGNATAQQQPVPKGLFAATTAWTASPRSTPLPPPAAPPSCSCRSSWRTRRTHHRPGHPGRDAECWRWPPWWRATASGSRRPGRRDQAVPGRPAVVGTRGLHRRQHHRRHPVGPADLPLPVGRPQPDPRGPVGLCRVERWQLAWLIPRRSRSFDSPPTHAVQEEENMAQELKQQPKMTPSSPRPAVARALAAGAAGPSWPR